MPSDLPDNTVAVLHDKLVDCRPHVPDLSPRLYVLQTDFEALLCDVHQTSLLRRNVPDTVHPGGIRKISSVNRGHIHIDDVPVLQYLIPGRDPVADHIIDRGAHALWKSFVVERRRDRVMLFGDAAHPVVDLLRGNPLHDMFIQIVQYRDIDPGTLADPLHLVRVFDDASRRHQHPAAPVVVEFVVK